MNDKYRFQFRVRHCCSWMVNSRHNTLEEAVGRMSYVLRELSYVCDQQEFRIVTPDGITFMQEGRDAHY